MKRTFIAIKIPAEERLFNSIADFHEQLRNEKISWADQSNLHITLMFLGDTDEEKISEICTELYNISNTTKKFNFAVKGVGLFKNIRNPRVLWTGIECTEPLKNLQKEIEEKMKFFGFKGDNREYNPHLTFGRIRTLGSKDTLLNLLNQYKEMFFQTVQVEEFIYYESILSQSKPVYKIIEKFTLANV
ncbi:MAG: RNA 2',3'-cyclic phosphodiesterase [Bacteroidia bacterium]|nr:RNA 2',3'-cyclic phosphodiesterase [Bacteroidia bacterium]